MDLSRPEPGAQGGGSGLGGGQTGTGGAGSDAAVVRCGVPAGGTLMFWNFEKGDANDFAFNQLGDRPAWEKFNDQTVGYQERQVESTPRQPSCPDNRALKITTSGYSIWGSGVRGLILPTRSFYNGKGYSGLSFDVRATGVTFLTVKVFDRPTVNPSLGGTCRMCEGQWVVEQQIGSEWVNVRLRFSSFKLRGTNDLNLTAIDTKALIYFEFLTPRDSAGEVWLDDIALFK